MQKLFLSLVTFVFLSISAFGQILDPVEWSYSVERVSDDEAILTFKAEVEPTWHLYSQDIPPGGSIPTEFIFNESDDWEAIDTVFEYGVMHEEYDPNFMMVLKYYELQVEFKQRIKILSTEDFNVTGELTFMVCDATVCLPPEYIDYSFPVKGKVESKSEMSQPTESKEPVANEEPTSDDPDEMGNSTSDAETKGSVTNEEEAALDGSSASKDEQETADNSAEKTVPAPENQASRSLIGIFLLSFLGGFAALLTPCVFPMIPLTVSFFTKQSKTRAKGIANAIIYGLSIIILYTLIGFLITFFFGPDALNAFSTNPWVNIAFFVILVVFAISFFGAFEITLPSSWVNNADRASELGGLIGIFFMAFTLALVSFSCTGPIIGSLLFEAFSGGIQGPLVGMFGFSLALALPFGLFAAFPGWLNTLPKSGGWLNSVKVVLGFVELAFALKFLSTADLVWQAGILKREWFIVSWIAIFGLLTLYLLGKFRLPHDSPMDKIPVSRLFVAIFSLMFTIYLIPGLWGAPLKAISGFTPPMFYSESPEGFGGSAATVASTNSDTPDGADPAHCPHGLNCFHDFEKGKAYAKEVGKPIMLDFTGWGCVNCRKMEEQVWSDPRVLSRLRNDFVLISLYVDERERLPESEQGISEITGKKIKTVGNLWSEFQALHFQTNSQPYYVVIGHESMDGLTEPAAYDPDIEKFVDWLDRSKAAFKK